MHWSSRQKLTLPGQSNCVFNKIYIFHNKSNVCKTNSWRETAWQTFKRQTNVSSPPHPCCLGVKTWWDSTERRKQGNKQQKGDRENFRRSRLVWRHCSRPTLIDANWPPWRHLCSSVPQTSVLLLRFFWQSRVPVKQVNETWVWGSRGSSSCMLSTPVALLAPAPALTLVTVALHAAGHLPSLDARPTSLV